MQKGQTHTVDLANIGGGEPSPLVQKGQTHRVGYAVGMQFAVGIQCAVDVSAKRSNPHSGVRSR